MEIIDKYIKINKQIKNTEAKMFNSEKRKYDTTKYFLDEFISFLFASCIVSWGVCLSLVFDIAPFEKLHLIYLFITLFFSFIIYITNTGLLKKEKKIFKLILTIFFFSNVLFYGLIDMVFNISGIDGSIFGMLITIVIVHVKTVICYFFVIRPFKNKTESNYKHWNSIIVPLILERNKIEEKIVSDEDLIIETLEYSEKLNNVEHFYFYDLYRNVIAPKYEHISEKEMLEMKLSVEIKEVLLTE